MLINEVCKECKLTKKAIDYYEKQGLIQLKRDVNDYRLFDSDEITSLKEISMLRKLGISISDIKVILSSTDRQKALKDYKVMKEFQIDQFKVQQACLSDLLNNHYDIDSALNEIEQRLDNNSIIRDKLLQAFPGNYGIYLSLHFGRFLDEKIDSAQKVSAYKSIIEFLDDFENNLPEELEQYLKEAFDSLNSIHLKEMDDSVNTALNDYTTFMKENHGFITQYLEYRTSEEFKASSAYKLQQSLRELQSSNGYYDVFIPNLKILSNSYREYCEKLEIANKQFISEYPQAKNF